MAPYLDSAYPGRGHVDRVLGQVRLWGTVIQCERGWRGEHAYPNRLFVPLREGDARSRRLSEEIAAGLRDYGVPVSPLRWRQTPDTIAAAARAA